MKKLLAFILIALLIIPYAYADIDLASMSFDDLVTLRSQIQLELMSRDNWQSVTVPVGVWQIGVNIPAGHWSFTADPAYSGWLDISIAYGDLLNDLGTDLEAFKSTFYTAHSFNQYKPSFDLNLETGYIVIKNGPVIFTPYIGKPDLGFK